jgi:hypothetical protein
MNLPKEVYNIIVKEKEIADKNKKNPFNKERQVVHMIRFIVMDLYYMGVPYPSYTVNRSCARIRASHNDST